VLDEMITGLRWPGRSALQRYGVEPHLATYGKALGNGVAVSALVGVPELMARGGLETDEERVFLLSTTHGASSIGLAAAQAVMAEVRRVDVGAAMAAHGADLAEQLRAASAAAGVGEHLVVEGPGQNLVFGTRDADGRPSQWFRALAMQELCRGGVLGPSLVLCAAHDAADTDRTVEAWAAAARTYARALEDGVERHLVGGPTRPVFRRYA
jgi:glutamate-1-semialdehyde 2,1-aminomutase